MHRNKGKQSYKTSDDRKGSLKWLKTKIMCNHNLFGYYISIIGVLPILKKTKIPASKGPSIKGNEVNPRINPIA